MDRIEPPTELRGEILTRIHREEVRRARLYIFASLTSASLSLFGAIITVKYMISGFFQTSFYSYFSLLFSDPDLALSYWREFLFALIETAPLLGVTLLLVAVAAFLVSLHMFARNMKPTFIPSFS